MSRASEELDLRIQFSLVTRIRQAATVYKAAHPEVRSAELRQYLSALECLAEYVAAKRRRPRPVTAMPKTASRVIPFPQQQPNSSGPLTAA